MISRLEQIEYVNPEGLNKNPAFTNVVVVTGPAKTIYIGGQDAVDGSGNIVGKGDIMQQTEQVLSNLETAVKAVGGGLENIVKWNLYVVQGQSLRHGFEGFQKVWGGRPNPPAISMMFVSALANPDFLVEMDAVVVIPDRDR
jgi:enamine deaminase RidA (YjgF/YER057c/UK114 family)